MELEITRRQHYRTPYRLLGSYRALLALLVVISHTNNYLAAWVLPLALGNVGVFSFFVLSGFVIAEACDIFYPGAPHRFLFNRFLRLYPTYWGACGIAIVIYIALSHPEFNAGTATVSANLSIVLAEALPSSELRWISVIWAVSIELRFYFVAALIDYADRLANRRRLLKAGQLIGAAGAGFLVLYIYVWSTGLAQHAVLRHVPFFVLGFAYYRWLCYRGIGSLLIGLAAMLMTFHSYVAYNSPSPTTDVMFTTFVFASSVVLLGGVALVPKVPKRWEYFDKRLGDLTYSLYLVHWPIVYAVGRSSIEGFAGFMLVLVASVMLSVLLVFTVEKPILRWRDTIRRVRLYS